MGSGYECRVCLGGGVHVYGGGVYMTPHCAQLLPPAAAAGSGPLQCSWPTTGRAPWWHVVLASPRTASGQAIISNVQGSHAVPRFSAQVPCCWGEPCMMSPAVHVLELGWSGRERGEPSLACM